MRRMLILLFVTTILSLGCTIPASAQRRPAQRQRPAAHWVDPNRNTPNGTEYHTFFSRTIGDSVSCLIWLPPHYATSSRRYPVVYWLHGLGGNQQGGAGSFLPPLAAAIDACTAPPMIAVFVNGMVDGFYHDAPGGRPVQSVIIRDLIPHIDAVYRTVADRRGRAVEGYSMGGFGAAYLGFKFPDLFGVVSIMAGALLDVETMTGRHPDLMAKIWGNDREGYQAAHPFTWAERNAGQIRGRTFVRIAVGSDDPLRPRNEAMHELLTRLNIVHDFAIVDGVAHNGRRFYELRGPQGCAFYAEAFKGVD